VGYAYQYLLQAGRRESTNSTYTVGLNNYIYFCHVFILLTPSILVPGCMALPPITTIVFGHYLAWMFHADYSFNTIRSYTTAVKMWCRTQRRPNPTLDPITNLPDIAVSDIWKAIKRNSKPAQRRFAVTIAQLLAVSHTCDAGALCTLAVGRNVKAACCLAWFALLRGSEYTSPSTSTFDPAVHGCRGDVTFYPSVNNPRYITYCVKTSKTDTVDRRGFIATVYASGTNACAVLALAALFLADPQPDDSPLFRFDTPTSPLSRPDSTKSTFTRLFSRFLRANNFIDDNVSSHSFRRGGATALFRSGASEYMVMQAGRWRSTCWRFYIDNDHTFYHNFATKMATSAPVAGVHWDSEAVPSFAP
jgi:integrase